MQIRLQLAFNYCILEIVSLTFVCHDSENSVLRWQLVCLRADTDQKAKQPNIPEHENKLINQIRMPIFLFILFSCPFLLYLFSLKTFSLFLNLKQWFFFQTYHSNKQPSFPQMIYARLNFIFKNMNILDIWRPNIICNAKMTKYTVIVQL